MVTEACSDCSSALTVIESVSFYLCLEWAIIDYVKLINMRQKTHKILFLDTGYNCGILKPIILTSNEIFYCPSDLGVEMIHRNLGDIGRYGDPSVRKMVPLAVALSSISNPQLQVIDVLTKYSHDTEDEVAANAIFGLGMIGAGTNNARLAATLRQLAVFHVKNPSQLFMVRLAQGLVHLGKGTFTLDPLHTDRMLVDPVALAGQ